jgi:hypothetical protein
VSQMSYESAYPGVEFLPRSRNWWAWLKGSPAECVHLDDHVDFVVTVLPDTLYLRGKRALRRDPARPEVALCRDCLAETFTSEIAAYTGRVVAFEPDPEIFTQYFFVAEPDFEAAGLSPEVGNAVAERLAQDLGQCSRCSRPANWLWFSREQVISLDHVDRIRQESGEPLCGEHGARKLWTTFAGIPEANLFYMNLPYAESGAYFWI